jgi:hypothetical protein
MQKNGAVIVAHAGRFTNEAARLQYKTVAACLPPWMRLVETIARQAPASGLLWGLRCRCANGRRVAVGVAGPCHSLSRAEFSLLRLQSWRVTSACSQVHARPEVLRNGVNCHADALLQFSPLRRANRVCYDGDTSRRRVELSGSAKSRSNFQ